MGDNTLEGFAAADFGKVYDPPMTLQYGERDLNSNTTRVVHHFSMPANKSIVNVRAAYVADGSGDPVSGLSMVLKDSENDVVIHSETSAQMQLGSPGSPVASQGVSSATKVSLDIRNESGGNLTSASAPSGMMVVDLE